jgi:hypothetical protein
MKGVRSHAQHDTALAAIPSTSYIPTRWPATYAADFLRTHPGLLPDAVEVEMDTGSRGSASHAIRCWGMAIDVPVDALKKVLADAYLVEHHIPLEHADQQRADLYEAYTS